ncbi:MAG: hypothetical protein KF696_07015 [Planctomycetes bacterium]|nr:hypothetical protein [Planctomycetota bacterium]MCW8135306.1 hypothetical protein [Planctomycetota bacterium]
MRTLIPLLALCVLLAACDRTDPAQQARIAALETQAAELRDESTRQSAELQRLRDESASRPAPDRAAAPADHTDELRQAIARLEKRVAELEAAPKPAPPARPEPDSRTDQTEPAQPSPPNPERELEAVWPLVQSGADASAIDELSGLAMRGDKSFRDTVIQRLRDWVKQEPENARARLALAVLLTTRFIDLRNEPMKQGALAAEVKQEIERALEIDPGYYDAVHFLAILKVNYPSFTPEFKGAKTDLDKALEMQAQLPWEERFCDVYAAYGMWYRVQKKYDDALARVNDGLQKSSQNAGLLAEKANIEKARGE